jgi:FtsP/CotA-like multicopper oxidase with cupredoxin domain
MRRISRGLDLNQIDFGFVQAKPVALRTGGVRSGMMPVCRRASPVRAGLAGCSRAPARGQVFPWERGWKDTVLLGAGETIDVLIRFDRFRGIYLVHCHKLEHEDLGMMSNFEVV